jgi:hypothetical protein
MAWNPFRAIGDAVGRMFGHGEQPAAPQPERAPEPQERGFIERIIDRVTGADRRREEAERERQVSDLQRQVSDLQRQIEERERVGPAPPVQAPGPERELPKFAADVADFLARDERAFGTDSEIERELEGAVADFVMDRGGLDGLSVDASEWLRVPTVSEPFAAYWQSGGFTADQVLAGMTNISNIQITEGDDGDIHIEFDYDADVDGYEVHGHASS